MSITPSAYAKARSEIIALFGWNVDSLSPDQTLRIDCAVALRLVLDGLQGSIVRGETIDVNRMLTASEALARLLPPAVLAVPPSEQREDDDTEEQIAPLRKLYRHLHEQVHVLTHENAQLRAQLGLPVSGAGSTAVTPTEADITPPGEIGHAIVGKVAGPDDPPKPANVVIEGKPVASAAPLSRRPPDWDSTENGRRWRAWVDSGAAHHDRWGNYNE